MKYKFARRVIALAMSLALVASLLPMAVSANESNGEIVLTVGSTTAYVNGAPMPLDAPPFIERNPDRTMVPLRFIADAMGADIGWDAASRTATIDFAGETLSIVAGEALPDDMGTAVIQGGRTFVPVRFVAVQMGADVAWDAAAQAVTITLGAGGAVITPPTETPDPPADDTPPPAAGDADGTGIVVASADDGGVSGAMVVIGSGEGAWPFSAATDEDLRAFDPTPGATYRITFNVTNSGAGGWRIRWAYGLDLFGMNTAGDYAIVNDYPVSPGTVATVVPAHFNQDVSPDGTYSLVVDVTLDGSEQADGLIGNIALTGTAGSHDFTVNWVRVEQGGNTLAFWEN